MAKQRNGALRDECMTITNSKAHIYLITAAVQDFHVEPITLEIAVSENNKYTIKSIDPPYPDP